jgi:hypothetical protein
MVPPPPIYTVVGLLLSQKHSPPIQVFKHSFTTNGVPLQESVGVGVDVNVGVGVGVTQATNVTALNGDSDDNESAHRHDVNTVSPPPNMNDIGSLSQSTPVINIVNSLGFVTSIWKQSHVNGNVCVGVGVGVGVNP